MENKKADHAKQVASQVGKNDRIALHRPVADSRLKGERALVGRANGSFTSLKKAMHTSVYGKLKHPPKLLSIASDRSVQP